MLDHLRILLSVRVAMKEQRGATAVEYGILIAGIAALIAAVVFTLGGVIHGGLKDTCTTVHKKAPGVGNCNKA
jgi:pilus assembly protein Flp/PilA